MSLQSFESIVYVLGFTGLAAIGLLPIRCWRFMTNVVGRRSRAMPLLALIAFAISLAALVIEFNVIGRVFRCLTETYCGPSIASGWVQLAILGAVYLTFEGLALVILRISKPRATAALGSTQ